MLTLRIVQAYHGDSLILKYGSPGNEKYLLVDGGPNETYADHLKAELEKITAAGGVLDFIAISHVDGDHLVGILDLLAEIQEQQTNGQPETIDVGGLWINSFADTIDQGGGIANRFAAALAIAQQSAVPNSAAGLAGIGQGRQLRIRATQLGLGLNDSFPNNLVCVDDAPNPLQFDNLSLTVVGLTRANLNALRAEWETWLDTHEPNLASGNLRLMANADRSVPNLSSITFLVEADGKSILFTGDGRSDHLLDELDAAGRLDANGLLHVDVLKVPHHGSDRNVTKTFFRKVTADTYVISANGHPDNPDLATLIWIVEAAHAQSRPIRIVAANPELSLGKLLEEYKPADFGYVLEIMTSDAHFQDLELAA
jgi:hypothetical protein